MQDVEHKMPAKSCAQNDFSTSHREPDKRCAYHEAAAARFSPRPQFLLAAGALLSSLSISSITSGVSFGTKSKAFRFCSICSG